MHRHDPHPWGGGREPGRSPVVNRATSLPRIGVKPEDFPRVLTQGRPYLPQGVGTGCPFGTVPDFAPELEVGTMINLAERTNSTTLRRVSPGWGTAPGAKSWTNSSCASWPSRGLNRHRRFLRDCCPTRPNGRGGHWLSKPKSFDFFEIAPSTQPVSPEHPARRRLRPYAATISMVADRRLPPASTSVRFSGRQNPVRSIDRAPN
jgi:hypothetical protein